MSDKQKVTKVTLSSGKVVYLREMKIKHTEQAAQIAGPRAGENKPLLGLFMQKELLKLLIVAVGEKELRGMELEDLDSLFSFPEYNQLMKVIEQVTGGSEDMGKQATVELATFGSK